MKINTGFVNVNNVNDVIGASTVRGLKYVLALRVGLSRSYTNAKHHSDGTVEYMGRWKKITFTSGS